MTPAHCRKITLECCCLPCVPILHCLVGNVRMVIHEIGQTTHHCLLWRRVMYVMQPRRLTFFFLLHSLSFREFSRGFLLFFISRVRFWGQRLIFHRHNQVLASLCLGCSPPAPLPEAGRGERILKERRFLETKSTFIFPPIWPFPHQMT